MEILILNGSFMQLEIFDARITAQVSFQVQSNGFSRETASEA